ncbi:C-C motif chemokine 5-like [Hyla sarda]|uniref:C-C motif chemokine 5-like n=1 Tax=Hyla sarda TaxID=327740 RepID=UPI0024C220D3|nr:C-C motif chemokine 5-like [Hyla sarda]
MSPAALILVLTLASMCLISQVTSANLRTSDCCLRVNDKEIPYPNVKCYFQQTTAKGCNIDAVVFVTRRNRYLCAPPNSKWVNSLMVKVDQHKPQFRNKCGR